MFCPIPDESEPVNSGQKRKVKSNKKKKNTDTPLAKKPFLDELHEMIFGLKARGQITEQDIMLAVNDILSKLTFDYFITSERIVKEHVRTAVDCCVGIQKDLVAKMKEAQSTAKASANDVVRLKGELAAFKQALHSATKTHAHDRAELAALKDDMRHWKTNFTRDAHEIQAAKCADQHSTQIRTAVEERCAQILLQRDDAVRAQHTLEAELANVRQDLEGEQFLHRVAINVTQRLQQNLEDEQDNYELLENELQHARHAVTWSEEAYGALADMHAAYVWDMHVMQEENERASAEAKKAYEALSDAHDRAVGALKEGQRKVFETQAVVVMMEAQMKGVKMEVDALREQRDGFGRGEEAARKALGVVEVEREGMLAKLVAVSAQREEALRGQIEALKVVERLKRGKEEEDGDETKAEDQHDESGSGAQELSEPEAQEKLRDPIELDLAGRGVENDVVWDATPSDSENEEDDGYDVRDEAEREADTDYDTMSEGDASDVEEWRL